jgi:hypothetical protein
MPFKKGQSGNPRGRVPGTPNRSTKEMKEWSLELFQSEEWRASAKKRILAGKAPHLETHVLAVVMPKPKDGSASLTKEGDSWVFRWQD